MAQLLQLCSREQRAPRDDELYNQNTKKCRITYTTERIGTGCFDRLDDDTLAEVLFRLPMQSRIVFVNGICKQFVDVAHRHRVFKAMHVSRSGHINDTSEEVNNRLPSVRDWRFLCDTQIEDLKLLGRSMIDVPPKSNLQGLVKLSLHSLVALTVRYMRLNIDASKLKDLSLSCLKCGNDVIALLTKSNRLERLTMRCDLPRLTMSKIIDEWRKASDGFPPLRFLSIDYIGLDVTMQDVEKLDLEELHCQYIHDSIEKADFPSMRTLCVSFSDYEAKEAKKIPLMKKLVMSCPGLETLKLKPRFRDEAFSICAATAADEMKKEFPNLNVITLPHSTLPETTPLEARERYPNIMTINTDGSSKLTSAFQNAIDDAKAEADRVAAVVAANNHHGFG